MITKKRKLQIIGLCGAQGSGKTTVAEAVVNSPILPNDKKWRRRSLAQPIRDMLSVLVQPHHLVPMADKTAKPKELQGKSVRETMQLLGTEWGRNLIGQDIWLDALIRWAIGNNCKRIIVDDLRMQNEFDFIKNAGGLVVKVLRSKADRYHDQHSSEAQWNNWLPSLFVVNDTTPAECAEEIITFAENFFI
jgi:hypothetical protein